VVGTRIIEAGQTVRDLCLQETGGFENLNAFADRLYTLGLLPVASLDALPTGVLDRAAVADLMENELQVNDYDRRLRNGLRVSQGSDTDVVPLPAQRGIGYDRVGIDNTIA